ncbi:putative tricarboxylic transport membrane protein [Mesorhizobium sp. J18]|uniref:tripartite tricarboxylate transporter TctB family protein n=1 Tax=Mesorhizobium sp. J18 TaxID=935263 RepID=UPI00119B9AC5|nr:tripartite tricarboxylate transporter TctB family protein [Mesorhizobium sp. J18]TWG92397.1 putative tricarboxylic transport membrane protein [Mesorhizobium sp. J18]
MSLPHEQDGRRRPDRAGLVIAAGLAVLAAVIFWDAQRLGGVATYARIGPKTMPMVIGICLAALAVWTAIEAWRGDFPERERQNLPPLVWVVGGLAAQMLLLKAAGFSIATGLLFAATARAFGKGPLWKTVPIGILLAFVVWFVFAKGLQLSLPPGPIERLI